MSQLEKKSEAVLPMTVHGSINIPEAAVPPSTQSIDAQRQIRREEASTPFSPISDDSGRWTSTSLWAPSSKYLIHGGPGFSIGILDSIAVTVERLPVPVPTPSMLEATDASNFSLSEVTSLALAGESQVWAGTETGSLHVFDLCPGPKLSNHGYSKLPDPITSIRTDQFPAPIIRDTSLNGKRPTTEVLVGSNNGNLTVISGESDRRGGLCKVAKCPRKVIPLVTTEKGGNSEIHCMVLVPTSLAKEECYWCGCGPNIVVLRRSTWQVVTKLDGSLGLPLHIKAGLHVSALEATEHGVWSTLSKSSTITLWDPENLAQPKLKIPC